MLKCNSCGGAYPDPLETGLTYVHACPPQIVDTPEILDAQNNIVTPAKFKPTPNPRDESLIPHPDKPGEYRMVSEGSGVTRVPEQLPLR